jgi:flagellar motor switch protein FliN
MLDSMAPQLSPWQRIVKTTERLVFDEAPRIIRQLQNPETVPRTLGQGIRLGIDVGLSVIAATQQQPPQQAITAGRPVTKNSAPTARRARKISYAPDLDGQADPGEIVWTWVAFEEDPSRGKDRPVLVVGRDSTTLLGLMLSSQERHGTDRAWVAIGSGSWDYEGRVSWVRLDRVLDVPVQLTPEIGRTRLTIKNLLQLSQGSVVELDGLAGQPLDVLINGYLITQGEVVVVNDKYGIRLTEIITPSERIQKLSRS